MFQGVSSFHVLAKRLGVDPMLLSIGKPTCTRVSPYAVVVEITSKADRTTQTLRYERRSVSSLIPQAGLEISRGVYTSTIDLLPVLKKEYNIVLTDQEIVTEIFPAGCETYTVKLAPCHLLYVGEFTVRQRPVATTISTLVPLDYIQGCVLQLESYPDPLSYLFFNKDYSSVNPALLTLEAGDRVPVSLVSYLNACTEYEWVYDTLAAPRNLYWSKILYNGLTQQYPTSNTSFDRVAVIEVSSHHCTDLKGIVYFHYNVV